MQNKNEKTELRRFLEQYLKNRRLSDTKQSFAEFLKGEGSDPKAAAEHSFAEALKTYKQSLPTYGRQAEALAESGLLGSGYAARLGEVKRARLENERVKIEDALNSAQKTARADYARYLSEYKKTNSPTRTEEQRRRERMIEAFVENDIRDYDKAYAYAKGLGYENEFTRELFEAALMLLKQQDSLQIFRP